MLILSAYSGGALSRSNAMQLLGLEWYGELLEALDEQGIARPTVSDEVREQMVADVIAVLGDPEARSEEKS